MKAKLTLLAALCGLTTAAFAATPNDGSVLPFPQPPMESVVKPRLQDTTMKWPAPPQRLPKDAPKEAAETAALAQPDLVRGLEGRTPKRVIVVPNRIVNVVV